jgi:zona occludens toxin
MLNAQLGRPGGGKTYEVVKYQILPAILKDKRKVVTNIPLQLDHIRKVHGEEYAQLVDVIDGKFHDFAGVRPFSSAKDFLKYDDWRNEQGQGPLFIVDEAHLSIGRNAEAAVLEYLSMHRHYGHDIIVVTQNQRKLHRDLRDMIEVAYHCAKMAAYGDDTSYIRKTYHGVENMREPIHIEERQYEPPIFEYYKSHTKNDGAVTEASVKDSKANLNPYAKAVKIGIATSIVFTVGAFANLFYGGDDKPEQPETTVSSPAVKQPPLPNGVAEQSINVQEVVKTQPKEEEEELSASERIRKQREKESKRYHPFSKVQLHIDGFYSDVATGENKVYFSASRNGQKLFKLALKDFFMAGYDVNVLGDCVVEIIYFDYRDFLTCDAPTIGIKADENIAMNSDS